MSDFRLKVFQSVAKNLSFTKASQELFVSQPAITKHIQELETYYQARLFDRQGSKISLTKAGELLLKHSEKILDDYKQLEYEMHLLHNEYIGELKLGASTTIAQYVLPPLLANFIAKFPQINLSLINGNSRGVEAALQEHRIDLGLITHIPSILLQRIKILQYFYLSSSFRSKFVSHTLEKEAILSCKLLIIMLFCHIFLLGKSFAPS